MMRSADPFSRLLAYAVLGGALVLGGCDTHPETPERSELTPDNGAIERVRQSALGAVADFSLLWFNSAPIHGMSTGELSVGAVKFYDNTGATVLIEGPWSVDVTADSTLRPAVVFDDQLPVGRYVAVAVMVDAVTTSDQAGLHTWSCTGNCTVTVPVAAIVDEEQANGVVLTLDVTQSFAELGTLAFEPDFVTWDEMVETRSLVFYDQHVASPSPLSNEFHATHALSYDGATAVRG